MNQRVELRFGAWRRGIARTAVLAVLASLTSCGDGSLQTYSVGGSVTGLSGTGLVMQSNGTDSLAVSTNGTFSFSKRLVGGSGYKITILAQPTNPIQNCVVMNGTGSGTLLNANVTSVAVRCGDVGRFAYTNNVGSQGLTGGFPPAFITGYFIDAVTGALRPVDGGSVALGQVWAEGFAIEPLGRFAFIARQIPDVYSLVGSFPIDQTTGALTGNTNIVFALPSQCCDLNLQTIVDPLGRFLFVATNVGLFVYTIDQTTGALTLASSIPFFPPVGYSSQQPMAVDRSGKYLYVGPTGNAAGNYIAAYQINQTTGALSPVPGSPFPADQRGVATSIVIDPLGQFVYVTNVQQGFSPTQGFSPADSSVSAYKLISSTGALSQIKGSPFTSAGAGGSYIVSLIFHPSGAYAYWMDSSGAVTTYSVDAQTGALHDGVASLPASSSFQAALDPSGKFLFIVNEGPYDAETSATIKNHIAIFAVDADTGALTQSRDSPFYAPDVGNFTRVEIYASP